MNINDKVTLLVIASFLLFSNLIFPPQLFKKKILRKLWAWSTRSSQRYNMEPMKLHQELTEPQTFLIKKFSPSCKFLSSLQVSEVIPNFKHAIILKLWIIHQFFKFLRFASFLKKLRCLDFLTIWQITTPLPLDLPTTNLQQQHWLVS